MEPTTEHRTLNTEYLQSSANLCTTHRQPPTSRIRHPASRIANRPTPTYPDRSRPIQSHPDSPRLKAKSVVGSRPRLCRGGQPQQHTQLRPGSRNNLVSVIRLDEQEAQTIRGERRVLGANLPSPLFLHFL